MMEDPGDKMEEIYALPSKLKYTESWLKLKEKRGVRYFLLLYKAVQIVDRYFY